MFLDNVQILCFKSYIYSVSYILSKIDSFKKKDEVIQILNADYIVSQNHIFHGVNQAIQAFDRCENFAKDVGVEIMLRCSAQRQISMALDMLGLKEGQMNLYVVLVNCSDYSNELFSIFSNNVDVLRCDLKKVKETYKISDLELMSVSVEDAIIDRITKLTVDY